jgi:hypothetical protein
VWQGRAPRRGLVRANAAGGSARGADRGARRPARRSRRPPPPRGSTPLARGRGTAQRRAPREGLPGRARGVPACARTSAADRPACHAACGMRHAQCAAGRVAPPSLRTTARRRAPPPSPHPPMPGQGAAGEGCPTGLGQPQGAVPNGGGGASTVRRPMVTPATSRDAARTGCGSRPAHRRGRPPPAARAAAAAAAALRRTGPDCAGGGRGAQGGPALPAEPGAPAAAAAPWRRGAAGACCATGGQDGYWAARLTGFAPGRHSAAPPAPPAPNPRLVSASLGAPPPDHPQPHPPLAARQVSSVIKPAQRRPTAPSARRPLEGAAQAPRSPFPAPLGQRPRPRARPPRVAARQAPRPGPRARWWRPAGAMVGPAPRAGAPAAHAHRCRRRAARRRHCVHRARAVAAATSRAAAAAAAAAPPPLVCPRPTPQGNTQAKRSVDENDHDGLASGSPPMSPGSPLTYSPQVAMEPLARDDGGPRGPDFVGAAGWPAQPKLVPVVIVCESRGGGGSGRAPPRARGRSTGSLRRRVSVCLAHHPEAAAPAAAPSPPPSPIAGSHGGSHVEVEGSFDNWTTRQPLQHTGKDWTIIKLLPPGVYQVRSAARGFGGAPPAWPEPCACRAPRLRGPASPSRVRRRLHPSPASLRRPWPPAQYKFIVDGDWRYDPNQPAMYDEMNNVNNVIEVRGLRRGGGLPASWRRRRAALWRPAPATGPCPTPFQPQPIPHSLPPPPPNRSRSTCPRTSTTCRASSRRRRRPAATPTRRPPPRTTPRSRR